MLIRYMHATAPWNVMLVNSIPFRMCQQLRYKELRRDRVVKEGKIDLFFSFSHSWCSSMTLRACTQAKRHTNSDMSILTRNARPRIGCTHPIKNITLIWRRKQKWRLDFSVHLAQRNTFLCESHQLQKQQKVLQSGSVNGMFWVNSGHVQYRSRLHSCWDDVTADSRYIPLYIIHKKENIDRSCSACQRSLPSSKQSMFLFISVSFAVVWIVKLPGRKLHFLLHGSDPLHLPEPRL